MRVWLYLLSFIYMRIAERALSTLLCQSQQGFSYLAWRPQQACVGSRYTGMAVIAGLALTLFVAVLPVGWLWMLIRAEPEARESQDFPLFFFTKPVRTEVYWWQIALMGRKLLVASLVAALPRDSTSLHFSVLMLLAVSLAANAYIRPYRRKMDNYLETILLLHLMLGFQTSLLLATTSASSSSSSQQSSSSSSSIDSSTQFKSLQAVKDALGLLGFVMLLLMLGVEAIRRIFEWLGVSSKGLCFFNRRKTRRAAQAASSSVVSEAAIVVEASSDRSDKEGRRVDVVMGTLGPA